MAWAASAIRKPGVGIRTRRYRFFVAGATKFRTGPCRAGVIKNPGFIFKIEADGYVPCVTRVVCADARVAQFDIRLQVATATTVTGKAPPESGNFLLTEVPD